MTAEAQRIAIAEAVGFTEISWHYPQGFPGNFPGMSAPIGATSKDDYNLYGYQNGLYRKVPDYLSERMEEAKEQEELL